MPVLGISAFYHDSAAAVIDDAGRIVAAAQQERFTRRRHDPAWPADAIHYCLRHAGLRPKDLDLIVFYENPSRKFKRIVSGYVAAGEKGRKTFLDTFPEWATEKRRLGRWILGWFQDLDGAVDWRARLRFSEHHASHAASAYFPSPFREAAILTLDGVGEEACTSQAVGEGGRIRLLRELRYPHSLGLLYSAFTYYTGFKVNSGEYKMMGLASYGRPRFSELIRERLIHVAEDGTYAIQGRYVDGFAGPEIINAQFEALFGARARRPDEPLTGCHADIAASIQCVTEDIVLRLARSLAQETGLKQLCLAGGVALNCVANGKLARSGLYESVWVPPAPGDAGGAVGAALLGLYHVLGADRTVRACEPDGGVYLGPGYSDDQIRAVLRRRRAKSNYYAGPELVRVVAALLAAGQTVGWMQGRMEFGPRALGSRSILADPRLPEMQSRLNLKIKKRESFRPFAAAVLKSEATRWFDLSEASPYMGLVARVKSGRAGPEAAGDGDNFQARLQLVRSDVPAVTHVDCSARIQTVGPEDNPLFHALLARFFELTGCPILVNTSFNVRGEPIVCSPEDAYRCFATTDLDFLVMGGFAVDKRDLDPLDAFAFTTGYPPD